jgi:hypothetical protein
MDTDAGRVLGDEDGETTSVAGPAGRARAIDDSGGVAAVEDATCEHHCHPGRGAAYQTHGLRPLSWPL